MTDIRHLKAFIAVAEELNFHRAADRLGTVQPALSRLVRNLEDDIKVKLLERSTRNVRLTEPGRIFLAEARSLVSQLASAVRVAQQTGKGRVGTLTLGYMDFAVHRLLPDLLAPLVENSDIAVDLVYLSTAKQKIALMEGAIDAGVMIGDMAGPHVDSLFLAEERICVVLPESHRLAAKRKVRISDLLQERVLLGSESDWAAFRDFIFRLFAHEGATPQIVHEASSAAALLGMTAKGLGVTFYAGQPQLYGGGLAFRPIAPVSTISISLVWRKGAKLQLVKEVIRLAGLPRKPC